MRIRATVVATAFCGSVVLGLAAPREASAQVVPPIAERDENWGTVSTVTMVLGAATVTLMPRVYYNDPEATVGWKARWHFSVLAPAMTLTVATLLVDGPIKNAIESTRPGCTLDETNVAFPDSNCESFGGPSTHAFAAWSATGAGLGIFLFDTFGHSDGKFSAGAFIGNVVVPLSLSIVTSIGRSVEPGSAEAYEDVGQNFAGLLPGLGVGLLTGLFYGGMQRPNCGYGNNLVCW
jgi:hypothetical protein